MLRLINIQPFFWAVLAILARGLPIWCAGLAPCLPRTADRDLRRWRGPQSGRPVPERGSPPRRQTPAIPCRCAPRHLVTLSAQT